MAARKNISYFTEERLRNNNPNFFVNMRDEDLRRQVKRIIKDMRSNTIEEQDYIYFRNDKIISACLTESYSQWKSAETIKNALAYYFRTIISSINNPEAKEKLIQYYNNLLFTESRKSEATTPITKYVQIYLALIYNLINQS